METPKKAGKKLTADWELASGSKPKGLRPKKVQSVDSQVRKSLADNFKNMSAADIDATVRQGMTLRQRLTHDKLQQQNNPGSLVFGKFYYQSLRDLYSSSNNTEALLKPDPSLEIRSELIDAAASALRHPPNRSFMVQILKSTPALNQAEYVGVLRWMMSLHPASSSDQLKSGLAVLEATARLKLHEKFEREASLVRAKWDEILLEAIWSNREGWFTGPRLV